MKSRSWTTFIVVCALTAACAGPFDSAPDGNHAPGRVVHVADPAPELSAAGSGEADASQDDGIWRPIEPSNGEIGSSHGTFLDIDHIDADLLADALVSFAEHPTAAAFDALPLAGAVDLGLGPDIIASMPRAELRRADAWWLDVESFRAYAGPFSALALLRQFGAHDVIEGEHPHCASPPVDAPEGYESFRRISIQPTLGVSDGCLQWATVDLFVAADGLVAAITVDLWEP